MIRIEFQARGSPHAHPILWIKDAPKLDVNTDEEVISFIDKYQTCVIPDEENTDLRKLVLPLQNMYTHRLSENVVHVDLGSLIHQAGKH